MLLAALATACIEPEARFRLVHAPFKRRTVSLATAPEIVATLRGSKAALRYFSVLEVNRRVLLFARNGTFPHAATHATVVLFEGLSLERSREVVNDTRVAHNLAVIADERVWGFGGMLSDRRQAIHAYVLDGVFKRLEGLSLRSPVPGCIERRAGKSCEFDGRFSLARLRGGVFLYARANANPAGGGRFVQVARMSGAAWSPFERVRFLAGPSLFQKALSDQETATELADIYFASVNPNPVHDSLLGFFPTVVRTSASRTKRWAARAAILVALSLDGVTFSAPIELIQASPAGGEINDHVVDGLLTEQDEQNVGLLVHHGVPGTLIKLCPFHHLRRPHHLLPSNDPFEGKPSPPPQNHVPPPTAAANASSYVKMAPPSSQLVRYLLPREHLREWSLAAAASLLSS